MAEKEIELIQVTAPIPELEAIDGLEEREGKDSKKQPPHVGENDGYLVIWFPSPSPEMPLPSLLRPFVNNISPRGEINERNGGVTRLHSSTWKDPPLIDAITKVRILLPDENESTLQPCDSGAFEPLNRDVINRPPPLIQEHLQQQQYHHHLRPQFSYPLEPFELELVHSLPEENQRPGFLIPLRSIIQMLEGQAVYQAKLDRSLEFDGGGSPLQPEIDEFITTGVQDMLHSYQILITASPNHRTMMNHKKHRHQKHLTSGGLRREAQRMFESRFDILYLPPTSGFSHWLIFPMPR